MQCLTQLNATDFQVLAIQPDTYTACTYILVQPPELQTQVFNITAAEGLQLSAAIVAVWTIGFPKQFYGAYKSAEIHNIPDHAPFRYYLKYIIPVVVVALCVAAYFAFNSAVHKGAATANVLKDGLVSQTSSGQHFMNGNAKKDDDPNFYYIQNTPRINDLALSMPKYDEVTKPKIAPVPAACIQSKFFCQCYSQQATKLVTSAAFCKSVVANGYFVDFDNSGLDKQQAPPATGGENIPPMQRTQVAEASNLTQSQSAVNYVVPDDLQPVKNPRPHYANLQPPRL